MSIVVGYLATVEGRAALAAATDEAVRRSLPLVVVVNERGDETPEQQAEVVQALSRADEELTARGVQHEVRQVVGGRDVAESLIDAAEGSSAELIVIGLRRRSPVGKLILGANAQRILLDAPCPVLAVKPDPAS